MSNRVLRKHLKYQIPKLKLFVVREGKYPPLKISNPGDLLAFMEPMKHLSEEYFIVYHLDATMRVIGYQEVSHGTLVASMVHPREVFKAAIVANSFAIIAAHNHPSGSLEPSFEDEDITRRLVQVGRILCIQLVDHIIVSHLGHQSIRELYPELFNS